MGLFARTLSGDTLRIAPIGRPSSNFAFIDQEFPGYPWKSPLRRLFSQVRSHEGQTVVVEELNPLGAEDLATENEDLKKHFNVTIGSRVRRISFFKDDFKSAVDLNEVDERSFIGNAIVKEDKVPERVISRVYESVIRPSRHENNFIRGAPAWQCRVANRTFSVNGFLYAQQNNATNVCAHVACRTAASKFHRDGDMTYREMNELLGIDHVASRVGSGSGLTSAQMVKILEAAGAKCRSYAFPCQDADFDSPTFQQLIYGSIESGYPALICFATEDGAYHAIPVFGHTFNQDSWVPHAEESYFKVGDGTRYTQSQSWLSSFVAHDDNWGSNFCLPQHFLHTRTDCKDWPEGPRPCPQQSECVAYILCTQPDEVEVDPLDAELYGIDYLLSMLTDLPETPDRWEHRLKQYAQNRKLVVRPILVKGVEYLEHLRKLVDWNGDSIKPQMVEVLEHWPRFPSGYVWMVELSVPELFSTNRRKVGEVLIRADRPLTDRLDFQSYVLARIPGYFAIHTGDPSRPEYKFFDSGAGSHVSVFGCESDDNRS